MVYGDRERGLPLGGANQRLEKRTLGDFQRWAIRRLYNVVPFEHYDVKAKAYCRAADNPRVPSIPGTVD